MDATRTHWIRAAVAAAFFGVVGGACSFAQREGCDVDGTSWCDGNALAACQPNPDCRDHPNTCSPRSTVVETACPAERPVCAQPTRQAVCQVSGVNGTCTAGPSLGPWRVGPVGDFNGDRLPDVVGLGAPSAMLLGQADGSFVPASAAPPAGIGLGLGAAAADVNGDGKLDLVLDVGLGSGAATLDDVALALGHGDGTFDDPAPVHAHPGVLAPLAAVGDFDGDGVADAVAFDDHGFDAFVVLGGAVPQPIPSQHLTFCTTYCEILGAADFNGDGKADLLVQTGTGVNVAFGAGQGVLSPGPATDTPAASYQAGDVDGDGHLDLAGSFQGQFQVLRGRGDGTFGAPEEQPPTAYQVDLAALADVDGDGALDLVGTTDGFLLVLQRGVGDGTFGPPRYYDPARGALSATVMTPNADGSRSLALAVTDETATPSATVLRVFPSRCYE
jgi:hypothetical protein